MDYASAAQGNYNNQGAGLGAKTEAPRTISSAASRIDELNDRLVKATEGLSMISSQIGALTPVTGKQPSMTTATEASGAVHRLNRSADQAHCTLGEIDCLISSIGRALG